MSERDELAADIRGLGITVIDGPPVDLSEPLAQHLHNLGYRRPRTITTIDELDDAVYAAFEDDGHLVLSDRQGRPWIIWADEDGDEVVNSWPQEEDPERLTLSDIRLPATVMPHGARNLLHEGSEA